MNTKYILLQNIKEKEENSSSSITNNLINDNIKKTFIFSIHNNDKVTVIDISNLRNNDFNLFDVTEEINLNIKFSLFSYNSLLENTPNRMFTTGDSIYIYKHLGNPKQTYFGKFSIMSKSFKYPVEMNGLNGSTLTACYDGQDYIYFYNYCQIFLSGMLNIERFNIRTQTTELYHKLTIPRNQIGLKTLSFFHNGILYTLGGVWDSYLTSFNLQSKSFDIYTIKELKDEMNSLRKMFFPTPKLACTDNRGNIYIYHKMNRFVRFNAETKELVELSTISFEKSIPLSIGITLLYHEVSENDSYIFLMGGKSLGNFVYSTSSKQWNKFYEKDECDRSTFGSAIFTLNLK